VDIARDQLITSVAWGLGPKNGKVGGWGVLLKLLCAGWNVYIPCSVANWNGKVEMSVQI
jgi:hypothetical protein